VILLLAMAVVVGGAARPAAGPVSRPNDTEGVPWSMARPLTWSDFLGKPPQTGQEGALTSYSLRYQTSCRGRRFEFSAAAVFLPRESWVKPAVLADPRLERATLKHEQTHFDLTEAFARQIRQSLATAADPCGRRSEPVQTAADRLVEQEAAMQARYDEESRHGLDAAGHERWDRHVAEWLLSLSAFR
jgi:hypothetical protein